MIEVVIDHRKRMRRIRKYHLILCLIGVVASLYSYYVEVKLESDPNYTALCDISPSISCTKVFASEWGKGFGIVGKIFGDNSTLNQPNGLYGAISYSLFVFTSRFESLFFAKATFLIGILGIVLSSYLAYILLIILDDICVVCYTVYGVNVLLFFTSVLLYRHMRSLYRLTNISSSPPKTEKKRV